jgi:hypothetical protein
MAVSCEHCIEILCFRKGGVHLDQVKKCQFKKNYGLVVLVNENMNLTSCRTVFLHKMPQ